MRLSNPSPPRRAINLTPLIDVVFLLLVFFMLASTFVKFTSVPITTAGISTSAPIAPHKIALIHIDRGDTVTLNGTTVAAGRLEAELRALHAGGSTTIVVTVRPGATVQALANTLAIARRVPFIQVRVTS